MKTRIEVRRPGHEVTVVRDLPLLWEGLQMSFPTIAATRVTTVIVHVPSEGEPEQIVYCAP